MAQVDFRQLMLKSIDHYIEVDHNAEGGLMYFERACKDQLEGLIRASGLDLDKLESLLLDTLSYLDFQGFTPEEIARKVLLPALSMAGRREIGDDEIQQIAYRRAEMATAGMARSAE